VSSGYAAFASTYPARDPRQARDRAWASRTADEVLLRGVGRERSARPRQAPHRYSRRAVSHPTTL